MHAKKLAHTIDEWITILLVLELYGIRASAAGV